MKARLKHRSRVTEGTRRRARRTHQAVLAAIASLQAELSQAKSDICDKIEEKIAVVSTALRSEIAALKAESDAASFVVNGRLDSQKKCLDLEERSKRQNLRIAGVKEGAEGGQKPSDFVVQLLVEVLRLDEKPVIDRAHRALRQRPGDNEPPRHLILRVHYCHAGEHPAEGPTQSAMEGSDSQVDEDPKPQEAVASEDRATTDPQECDSQDQTGPEPEDSAPQPNPSLSGEDENSQDSVQDNSAQMPVNINLSKLNTLEDMEDEEPQLEQEEEEEFLALDNEHPLVRRQHAALIKQLREELYRIAVDTREKLGVEKTEASLIQEKGLKIFRIQEQLARLHTRLEEHHQNRAQAETEYRQAQDHLEAGNRYFSNISSQHSKAKADVSQLQADIENLSLHIVFAQRACEDLHSNVKANRTTKSKAGADKNKAEEQKLKQDLYVERLTKELERLTQQVAMYESKASAQAEETQEARQVLSEVEMEMESLKMMRKQLLQLWNNSVLSLRRRDEDLSKMQEDVRTKEHQAISLDREIEGFKKTTTEEQEKNEALTLQLNRILMDGATSRKLISQKQAQYEALEAEYSISIRILSDSENTLNRLTKETRSHQAHLNNQRRQLEKENAVRLELEDKILTNMQQKLTHNKAAKYSQRLTSKKADLKKEKISQLWQLENEVVTVGLESIEVSQHLESLSLAQEALDEEKAKLQRMITANQAQITSFNGLIEKKETTIANFNRKISKITASTGNEDLSPLQIKVDALKAAIEELAMNIKNDQQLWMKRQTTLVGLTREIEANSKNMHKLQIEHTVMQQKEIHFKNQIEAEHQEHRDLEKNTKMLRGDLVKLNFMLSKNGQLSHALEKENVLMESDFLRRLKEAEQDSVEIQMTYEKTHDEKERLLNSLVEAERQILLWEKKIQLVKETRSALDSDVIHGEIVMMKTEIHRMEAQLIQLKRQQEQLLREGEETVVKRETIANRRKAMVHSSQKQATKGELSRQAQGLRRKIKDVHKHVAECEQVIKEQQESQGNLADALAQQKQRLIELCNTSNTLNHEIVDLEDAKVRNLDHLLTLQNRAKKLQGVSEGRYKASSTRESVRAALQTQTEHVQATSAILHQVCEEFPQHQGPLRRLTLALAGRAQAS
ncbi:coiled-coil domain-containing protein 40-like [Limanda limanda]|uniref:coiled-coil domain-containing protein 40-like n=1 Tax=Limanda limanda TaxID=27771 RepID=UPI0029C764A1|nr:coiled-coil domain-containing protein 40-like [Limanda limanda]